MTVLLGCKMLPNYLTAHLVVCETFLCCKPSKYPQDVPTLEVSYCKCDEFVSFHWLVSSSMADGHHHLLAAGWHQHACAPEPQRQESGQYCAACLTAADIWIDMGLQLSSLLNKHAEEQQWLNLPYANIPVIHMLKGSKQLMQMICSPPTWSVISTSDLSRAWKMPHQTHHPRTLDYQAGFLGFLTQCVAEVEEHVSVR